MTRPVKRSKDELIYSQRLAIDAEGKVLVWAGDASSALPLATAPAQEPVPLAYTPPHLTDKILAARPALEGERKQVTVLFADLKDSTELIRGLDPEAAQQLLDPALPSHDGRRAPLRGHGESGARRRHYGAVWRPYCPRGSRPARLLCLPGHAGGHAVVHRGGAPQPRPGTAYARGPQLRGGGGAGDWQRP